ncbi:hypothetical protein LshimejAT787_0705880 [Lyophyllum shimeji]|uniref:DUF4100 domain-containing protein n=1 Tax=Lyophyllum shimeji TaxID=47721 RepID=A0A9P3PQA4_LYOSH|nr:hypothetical protein LshimejAT787_0705880 [Lyophyllum shimeji]
MPDTGNTEDSTQASPGVARSTSQHSDSSSGTFAVATPMPTAGTPNAPFFKGKGIQDFLDSLEQHADQARINHDRLPQYILRYCHPRVRKVIEGEPLWAGSDWASCSAYLVDLYGSNDKTPPHTPERLRLWTDKHGEVGRIASIQDVDKYFRKFTQLSSTLLPNGLILARDLNLCFYRGIPAELRKRVKKRIPVANQKQNNAPTVSAMLAILRAEFDELDLDARPVVDSLDLEDETDSDDSDMEVDDAPPPPKQKKKSVTFKVPSKNTVPGAPVVDPAASSSEIENLTKQLRELKLMNVELSRKVDLAQPKAASANQPDTTCFICNLSGTHRLGVRFCPDAKRLIEEQLAMFNPSGRFVRADGSDLPNSRGTGHGVAKLLRDERQAQQHLKGKGRADIRDQPPHLSNFAGLQFDGRDVMDDEVYGVSAASTVPAWRATASPATRSGKESVRHDPLKRPAPKAKPDPPVIPRMTQTDNDTQRSSRLKTAAPEAPRATASKPSPEANSQVPAPQPSKSKAPNAKPTPAPPAINTKDGYRNAKRAPKDVEMRDGTGRYPPPKAGPTYHFTSSIQESFDALSLQEQILSTPITLTLGSLLGSSPEMQRRFANLTKTRREYTDKADKPVVANLVEALENDPNEDNEDECVWFTSQADADGDAPDSDDEEEYEAIFSPTIVKSESRVQVDYDPNVDDEDDIYARYASAVRMHVQPLYAMVTGRFRGKFAGQWVFFMVDCGSELNIVGTELYEKTTLPIDLDGTRWSLKGINGGPVPLGGCLRDAPVTIGGHRFDHHFFVSSGGVGSTRQDVILGQPWLQWYTAAISYTRKGEMQMRVWKEGDKGDVPTLCIPLCNPDAERNAKSLNLGHKHKATVETDDECMDESGN